MKLSFSIQYWNDMDWNAFRMAAIDARLQGIELYDIDGPVFQGKSSPTNPELAAATRRSLTNQGLTLPCVDSVGDFTDQRFVDELNECLGVAVNLGVAYVGIHTDSDNQAACVERMSRLLEAVAAPVSIPSVTASSCLTMH